MRFDEVERRIKKVEDKTLDLKIPPGTTFINYECLTKPEKLLLQQYYEIIGKSIKAGGEPPIELIRENRDLVNTLIMIMWRRSYDLFSHRFVPIFLLLATGGYDKIHEWLFWVRFNRFMIDVTRQLKEDVLLSETGRSVFGEEWDGAEDIPEDDPRWKKFDEVFNKGSEELKKNYTDKMDRFFKKPSRRKCQRTN